MAASRGVLVLYRSPPQTPATDRSNVFLISVPAGMIFGPYGIIGLCVASVCSAISRSFLNYTGRIGQKRPMRTDARTVLICRSQVVRANGDEAAITDFHLAMKVDESFHLAAIFWAVASSTKQ